MVMPALATTASLIGLVPGIVALGMVVSITKGTLTAKDSSGRRIREGKYIVKVSKSGEPTRYIGPFKTKAQAGNYAKKAKRRFPAYRVSVVT